MVKVFLICSGLGTINRGFESFTQECFEALSQEPSLDITLFKGGGNSYEKEISLWNFKRNSWISIGIGRFIGRSSYFIEQVSFFLSLLPHIHVRQPDIIYFSDGTIGNLIWHWRNLTRQTYKLLYSNGGPLSPPFPRWEHVQQVAPLHLQTALDVGETIEKQSLVPYGLNISEELEIFTQSEREELRRKLKLPEKSQLILSVGAIKATHKRMDYIIREFSSIPEPRPYLLLLGQQDSESPEIIQLGNQLLGTNSFQVRTVARNQMADYYKVADAFVLASLVEGFGRVFLEAMSYGLPCLAHDYEVTRYILGKEGFLANLELPGSLERLISQALAERYDIDKRYIRHRSIYSRFSWEQLRPSYIEMIQRCMATTNNATRQSLTLIK